MFGVLTVRPTHTKVWFVNVRVGVFLYVFCNTTGQWLHNHMLVYQYFSIPTLASCLAEASTEQFVSSV